MPATPPSNTLQRLMAFTPEDWDRAYAQYLANRVQAGETERYTRAEYPAQCVAWAREFP